MYRFNSRWVEMMIDYIHPITEARDDGFSPLKGELDRMKIRTNRGGVKLDYSFDELKVNYVNKMIDEANGSKLFFVVSPVWYGMDTLQFKPIKDLCEEKGITFIDFSNDPKYVHNDHFFQDGNHMNEKGADEFTKELVSLIKL